MPLIDKKTVHKACGLLFCYNEDQVIRDTLVHYLGQGIDLVVFDNYSTDQSVDIIEEFQREPGRYSGKILELVRVKTEGYEWFKILRTACDYMHKNLNHYEWILTIDADAIYYSPVRGVSLIEFMDAAKKYSYNVINGKLYEFYPTEKDDAKIASPQERMRYCRVKEQGLHFALKYYKIFRYHPSADFYTSEGHIVRIKRRRVLNKAKYIYKHYPWVSFEHGIRKIFKERKPRYVERKYKPTWHWHWLAMLPIQKDLIKHSADLTCYSEQKATISRRRFLWIMRLGILTNTLDLLSGAIGLVKSIGHLPGHMKNAVLAIAYIINALPYGSIHNSLRLLTREIKKDAMSLKSRKVALLDGLSIGLADNLKQKIMAYGSVIFQEPVTFDYPAVYHFLMTNFCNARCNFCNQNYGAHNREEITFDKFRIFCSHIPLSAAKAFYFSGGGEPLLSRDIFSIIKYVNDSFPWIDVHIRTNGLLINKYAKELAQLNISRLEISVHGIEEVNDAIIQSDSSAEIFKGIARLNARLKDLNKKMYKVFYPAVTMLNIKELPELVKRAAQLEINEVSVFFCRFYPGFEKRMGGKLNKEDSLYYHKEIYNETVKGAERLAKRLGVYFEHEPLFFEKFKQKPCRQPWKVVMVDWDGNIYPCNGGEVWFEEQVKSGKYNFGNLLKEHVYQFWNNDSYVMIRRTCSKRYNENFIPECRVCPNTICFVGADCESGHFLKRRPASSGNSSL